MIPLHIAKLLADNGFGTLDTDIFWEEAPLNAQGKPKDGIWVVERGSVVDRFNTTTQAFDIYSRYANKLTGASKLEDILAFLKDSYAEICTLPKVPPYSLRDYINVQITPTSSVENVGTDELDKVVRVISAEVKCNINQD